MAGDERTFQQCLSRDGMRDGIILPPVVPAVIELRLDHELQSLEGLTDRDFVPML